MLDAETKGRIDSARDILVGKVPDPKSQVEQITIALIYKFMDDMDRQSEELGGKATFFSSEFKKYGWANLLDKRFGGHERLLLYAEGIEKMDENKNIPRLFRDIFKGVFLPYRDPETLNLFLKEIDGFAYDHSERLGDAYEYLLSVLGTQGDAGQFRTPRHIIDFIVAVVGPQKHETVLDPACGTAGFLISAFKHIVKTNENLTPDERARLMTNFRGYDIAPDMVRLSRVNMYLHGFPNPAIHEYDALTSEERWDERCDVIMANPPFMTPKGGIRPHNRFAVKAKRSEVLFVDYIAEHLNPGGRAGVIVPEGIIFQSQNAYRALRKMLIENYLWAVVSLPAGVFNPYSGVKTSILFLDRNLARRTEDILFVKVQNDGFDLGAQRRPIEKNSLPQALEIIDSHKKAQKVQNEGIALTVSRKRILESPDIGLSGDRYRETVQVNSKWPMVRLGEVLDYEQPTKYIVSSVDYDDKYATPVLTAGKTFILGYTDEKNGVFQEKLPVIIFDDFTTATKFVDFPFKVKSSAMKILHADESKANIEFLFHTMQRIIFPVNEHKRYWISEYSKIKIPLPPLEIQRQMVAELEGYRKVIEGARQVIANYKPTIKINPKWPRVAIGEVCKLINGRAFKPNDWTRKDSGGMPIIRIQNLNNPDAEFNYFTGHVPDKLIVQKGDLLFSWSGSRGTSFGPHIWSHEHGILNQHIFKVEHPTSTHRQFLYYVLKEAVKEVEENLHGGVGLVHITKGNLERIEIPMPKLPVQEAVADALDVERALVEANRKLIEVFEKKIQSKLAEIWGEEKLDDA